MIRKCVIDKRVDEYDKTIQDLFFSEDEELLHRKEKVCVNLDDITTLDSGIHEIVVNDFSIDVLFIDKKESDRLFIMLMGSKTREYPEFKRWSWGKTIDANILYIADPNYKNEYGSNSSLYVGYREEVVCLIEKIRRILNIKNENLYFYGSSGGAVTAIHISNNFRGCNVISINGHTDIAKSILNDIQSKNKRECDKELAYDNEYWENMHILLNTPDVKYTFAINIRSDWDLHYVRKIEEALGVKFNYGVNKFKNIGMWLYCRDPKNEGESGHGYQDNRIFYLPLEEFHDRFIKNDVDLSDYDKYMYFILSELYADRYRKNKVK